MLENPVSQVISTTCLESAFFLKADKKEKCDDWSFISLLVFLQAAQSHHTTQNKGHLKIQKDQQGQKIIKHENNNNDSSFSFVYAQDSTPTKEQTIGFITRTAEAVIGSEYNSIRTTEIKFVYDRYKRISSSCVDREVLSKFLVMWNKVWEILTMKNVVEKK